MYVIGLLFTIITLGFAAYLGWTFYSDYRTATGTMWRRLLKAAQDSATILWTKFCLVLAAVVGQIDNIADLVGQPEAKDFINTWVGNPKLIASLMLAIAFITMAARKRTL